jgi:hypothetical protein
LRLTKNNDVLCISLDPQPPFAPPFCCDAGSAYFAFSLHKQPVLNELQTLALSPRISSSNFLQLNQGEVKIVLSGLYEVNYHMGFESIDLCCSSDASFRGFLELRTLRSPTFAPVPGSLASCSLTKEAGALSTQSVDKTVAIKLSQGDILRVRFSRVLGTTSATTRGEGECSMFVKLLSTFA